MKYFISAGEASGDLHASHLIKALRDADAEASFAFLGGDLMREAAGCDPVIHYRHMAYMGFSEVLRHLRQILGNFRRARQALEQSHPDALILVDYPSFNLRLAKAARRMGIPVYYYISPKVWAWKEHRVSDIRRLVERVYCILPFEVDFYRSRHDMDVTYVGNPSREEVDARLASLPAKGDFMLRHGLVAEKPLVALVPGSRRGEIRNNLPVMLAAAARFDGCQMAVAVAPGVERSFYEEYAAAGVVFVEGDTLALMAMADAALVTSGTATLECALAGTPQVVCYRANGSRLSYAVMSRILKVDYVSLPNLIAGRGIIPEMLLHRCNPDAVARELGRILPGGEGRAAQLAGYDEMRRRLGVSDAAAVTAASIVASLRAYKS